MPAKGLSIKLNAAFDGGGGMGGILGIYGCVAGAFVENGLIRRAARGGASWLCTLGDTI